MKNILKDADRTSLTRALRARERHAIDVAAHKRMVPVAGLPSHYLAMQRWSVVERTLSQLAKSADRLGGPTAADRERARRCVALLADTFGV